MALFAIYKFKLENFKHRQITMEFPEKEANTQHTGQYRTLEEFFESYFPQRSGSMNIAEHKKKGRGKNKTTEFDPHLNTIEEHRNRIVVFRMQANKTKSIEQADWTKKKEPHHPDCRVIIDFREDHCFMAIERKNTAFDPDRACDILSGSFNRMMLDPGVKVHFKRLEKQALFWDAVNEIRDKFSDAIRRVQFDFVGSEEQPEKGNESDKEQQNNDSQFADALTQWVGLISGRGQLSVEIENDYKLARVTADLTRMSNLCNRNRDYNLTVKFRDFGLFRYGQDIKAQLGLNDEVIEAFLPQPQTWVSGDLFEEPVAPEKMKNELIRWFDKVLKLFSDYGTKTSIKQVGITSDRL